MASEVVPEPTLLTDEAHRALILVVEDDPQMNRFLVVTLASRGYRTASACDGSEGLEKAIALRPDLIMSDVVMPRMGGMELLAELRSRPEFDDTPVLVLSGQDDVDLRVKMLDEAQDYVLKPCSGREIVARVKNQVTMKRVRDVLQTELSSRHDDVEALARAVAARKRDLNVALESLRRAHAHAERMSQFKTSLLTMFSHELKTPMTVLMLQLDRLRGERHGSLTAAQHDMVDGIDGATGRLRTLVDSLLDYARIESERLTAHLDPFDGNALATEVVAEMQQAAAHKKLRLDLVTGEMPLLVSDRMLVRTILVNLLTNAVKFTPAGSVTLAAEYRGEHRFVITDTGPGIAKEEQDRIFEPFVHIEPMRNKHHPGFGLGLALVREMAQALGCRLEVASEPGMGSSFTVAFPAKAPG